MPTNTSKEYQIDKEAYYTQISIFFGFPIFHNRDEQVKR